ncbi:Fructose-1,6-bisphosphatase, cytosolic [Glycine max]|nr:Fructose-1,6-bisphosphatase, cytosolic [Glycine max]
MKLVLSTRSGVNGFTLDPSLGEIILTHLDIKKGKIYSVNEGNAKNWDDLLPSMWRTARGHAFTGNQRMENCKYPKDGSSPKSLRYIGSMVANVHCTLLYGGIFLYPVDKKSPKGKLQYDNFNLYLIFPNVLYGVFPMSFLMEQAGGHAFTGNQRMLDCSEAEQSKAATFVFGLDLLGYDMDWDTSGEAPAIQYRDDI